MFQHDTEPHQEGAARGRRIVQDIRQEIDTLDQSCGCEHGCQENGMVEDREDSGNRDPPVLDVATAAGRPVGTRLETLNPGIGAGEGRLEIVQSLREKMLGGGGRGSLLEVHGVEPHAEEFGKGCEESRTP